MDIGPTVRTLRQARDLTLSELAERSGVSRAMLCEIEAGRKNPTIRVVSQVAAGLRCTISELLGLPSAGPAEVAVQRSGERRVLVDPETQIERHLLSPGLVQRGVQVLFYELPARAGISDFPPEQPGVVEHVTALKGRIALDVGTERIELGAGDSATYEGSIMHGFSNPGDEPAEMLLVIVSPPSMPTPSA